MAVLMEEAICLLIFCMTLGGVLIRRRWQRNIPKMFHRNELRKEREIAKKKLEVEAVNTPDQLAQHGKATRQLIALEKELDTIKAAYREKSVMVRWAPWFVGWMVEFGFVVPATMLWGHLEIVMFPDWLVGGLWEKLFSGSMWKLITVIPGALEYAYLRLSQWDAAAHVIDKQLSWSPVFLSNAEWRLQKMLAAGRKPGSATNYRSGGVAFSVGFDEPWLRSVGPFGWFVLCFVTTRYLLSVWEYAMNNRRKTAAPAVGGGGETKKSI